MTEPSFNSYMKKGVEAGTLFIFFFDNLGNLEDYLELFSIGKINIVKMFC